MKSKATGKTRITKRLFTNDQIRSIRRLYEQQPRPEHMTAAYIASKLGVRNDVIRRIVKYISYPDV